MKSVKATLFELEQLTKNLRMGTPAQYLKVCYRVSEILLENTQFTCCIDIRNRFVTLTVFYYEGDKLISDIYFYHRVTGRAFNAPLESRKEFKECLKRFIKQVEINCDE